jgi:hypothetical protein
VTAVVDWTQHELIVLRTRKRDHSLRRLNGRCPRWLNLSDPMSISAKLRHLVQHGSPTWRSPICTRRSRVQQFSRRLPRRGCNRPADWKAVGPQVIQVTKVSGWKVQGDKGSCRSCVYQECKLSRVR